MLCGIIVLGCFLAGRTIADAMKRRKETLKSLIVAISQAETYVDASVPVKEIYERLSGKGEVGEMFSDMSKSDEKSCEKLWETGLRGLSVTEDDKKPLREFARSLGKTTGEEQKKAFNLCLAGLAKQLEGAEGKYEKEGAVYQKLGACAGLLISIFLI